MVVKEETTNTYKMYIFNPSTENVDIITVKDQSPEVVEVLFENIKEEYANKPTKQELETGISIGTKKETFNINEINKEKEEMSTVMEINTNEIDNNYNKNMNIGLTICILLFGIIAGIFTFKKLYKK